MNDDERNGTTATPTTDKQDDTKMDTSPTHSKRDVQSSREMPGTSIDSSKTVPIQPFWTTRAHAWFKLTEIQFESHGIRSEKAKYQRTLMAITPEMTDCLMDVLNDPPQHDQYRELKRILLERFTQSDEEKLDLLLKGEDLGDLKPSEALRKLQSLAGSDFTPKVTRSLWLRKLPEVIRIPLVAQPTVTPGELARTADRMYATLAPAARVVSAVDKTGRSRERLKSDNVNQSTTNTNKYDDCLTRIETLLTELKVNLRGRSVSQRPSSRRYDSRSRSRSSNRTQKGLLCWYHMKYGPTARKCRQPCNFMTAPSHILTRKSPTSNMDVDIQQKNQ